MDDRPDRELAGLDTERPLPPALVARLESALLDDAAARAAHATGDDRTSMFFDALDAPRPLPASTRAALEDALTRSPAPRWQPLLAVAAVLLLVIGSAAALRVGQGRGADRNMAAGPSRSVPGADVPPVLQAPAAGAAESSKAAARAVPPSTARKAGTTTTRGCGTACLAGAAAAAGTPASPPAGAAAPLPPPAPPYVSGVSPSNGPSAGGTPVTITGAGFTGASGILFGSTPAPTFTVVSDTEIRAVSPPSSQPQSVVVSVTFPNSTKSAGTGGAWFTYT
jgi:hypothetical protein